MDFARTWIRSLDQFSSLILNPLCTPHSLSLYFTKRRVGKVTNTLTHTLAQTLTHTLSPSLSLFRKDEPTLSFSLSYIDTCTNTRTHTLSLSLQHSHTPQLHPCFLFTFLVVSLIARSNLYSLSPLLPLSFSLSPSPPQSFSIFSVSCSV